MPQWVRILQHSIEFRGLCSILAPQFNIKLLPSFMLADLVLLRVEELEVSNRPLTNIFAIVSILVLHLVEAETVFRCFGGSFYDKISNIKDELTFHLWYSCMVSLRKKVEGIGSISIG